MTELVAKAQRIAVLTGAGISTASGIPDFRGPQGLWTKNPAAQAMFDIDEYVASAAVRAEAWKFRRAAAAWDAEPNAGHRALVNLERQGRLTGLIRSTRQPVSATSPCPWAPRSSSSTPSPPRTTKKPPPSSPPPIEQILPTLVT